jgi:non-homologous end joining protein Ku
VLQGEPQQLGITPTFAHGVEKAQSERFRLIQSGQWTEAREQLVDVKITGGELAGPAEAAPALDLMATLEESVRAAKRAHRHPSARARP